VLEHTARLADHAGKLSLVLEHVREILIECDHCARREKRDIIMGADVEEALDARIRRVARLSGKRLYSNRSPSSIQLGRKSGRSMVSALLNS
jgi:predicted ATP-dependent protease